MLPLTIGILSWGQHKTLRNTLDSYIEFGLLKKAAQVFIFFQEISDEDRAIADEYSLHYIGADTNIGIADAYQQMLGNVSQPFYLFLENDWVLSEPNDSNRLEQGIYLLQDNVEVVRYRSKVNPGSPLWTAQFATKELSRPEHLLDSVHWIDDPAAAFPDYINKRIVLDEPWYYTDAAHANWTNNPHMVRTDWARFVLAPRISGDIERNLQEWWQEQEYIVAQGKGLFTHWRIG